MSYDKHTWATGEVITKEKLNNIEDGIANAGSGGGMKSVISNGNKSENSFISNSDFPTFNDLKNYIFDCLDNMRPIDIQVINTEYSTEYYLFKKVDYVPNSSHFVAIFYDFNDTRGCNITENSIICFDNEN